MNTHPMHMVPLSPAEELGQLIRRHRVDRDLTLHDVADRCGVKVSAARAWEHGELVPTSREWARLCNLVHRALRGRAAVFQAARAVVATPGEAALDVEKSRTYMQQEPTRQDAQNVSALAKELPSIADAPSLGEAIRRARVIEGMTQDEFGEIVGVVGQAVSQWELGHACPVLENFSKLVQLVPEIERWRSECRDIEKPKPGPKPEGFTTPGGTGRQPVTFLPMLIDFKTAPPQEPAPSTIHECGAAYALAKLGVERVARELAEIEEKRRSLLGDMDAATSKLASATEALEAAVRKAVYS